MRDKLSLTFHLNMATIWITLVWSLCLWRVSLAAPNCTLIDNVLDCKITTNVDFTNLSSVAEDISLGFTEGNTVSFQDSIFPYLPVLRTLTVDLRYINDLSIGAFKLLSNLENLQFDNSDIYRPLPPLSFKSGTLEGLTALKTLNISEIGITQIDTDAFLDLTELTHLVMLQNRVSSLPNSVFSTTKLESLIIADMELNELSLSTFQGLQGLKVFQFTHSKLQTMDASVFSEMSNLEKINLENNELSSLPMELFKGLVNLQELNLRNSKNLTTLRNGVFNDLTKLTTLDICFSGVEVIEDRVFENLGLLKYLKLTDNKLQTITSNTLTGLTSLRSLELENNAITTIPANAFVDSPNVLIIHLYNNEIKDIDLQAFNGVDLSVTTLYNNNLTTLPFGVFDSLNNMNHIDLSDNPWQCNCNITWLQSWIENQPESFVLENSLTTICNSPADKQGDLLQAYIEQAYDDCLPPPGAPPVTTAAPTMTTDNSTTIALDTTGNDEDNSGTSTSKATIIGIVVGCILLALIILLVVVIAMYCRHKKYAFWAPPPTDELDGKRSPNDLKYLARHPVGSFYQNPDTYSISAMWETESMAGDRRYSMDSDSRRDSIKNKYVYENPALDVTDTNDNSVVVVDTNGTTVKELPLSVAALPVNGHLHSSNESVQSSQGNNVSPVPAHGYGPGPDHIAVPIPDYDQVDGLDDAPERYQMNNLARPDDYSHGTESPRAHSISSMSDDAPEMNNLARPGDYLPGSESPRAQSISSMSDVAPEQQQDPSVREDTPELHAAIDPPQAVVTLQTDRSTPPSHDYEHLNVEPSTPSSVHDYSSLQYEEEPTRPDSGLKLNVNAHEADDYEHLHEPDTPSSPHDYVGLQINHAPAESPPAVPEFHGSSTGAHGGTAAYANASYYDSDE